MPYHILRHIPVAAAAGLLLVAVHVPNALAQAPRGSEARVLERVLCLLPVRPNVPIRLIDPELAADAEAIGRLDAFLVREGNGRVRPIIYLNRRAAVFENALRGADIDLAILAVVIKHEMAHLAGAGEPEARRVERDLFERLVADGRVPLPDGMRYLNALDGQHLRETR
jgi:hypothetical protein